MSLADCFRTELFAPVVLVALRARQIHLAQAAVVQVASRFKVAPVLCVDGDVHRHAARLLPDVSGEAKQLGGFVLEGWGLLAPLAALLDPALEIDEPRADRVAARIVRR